MSAIKPVSEECGVTKKAARKAWTRPELKQIGQINDISGPDGTGPEGGKNAKS
jgi:hypothetical protein